MSGAGLEGHKRVGHRAARFVVEMRLDVAAHSLAQGADLGEDLARCSPPHSIGNAYAVHAKPVDERVQLEKLAEIGAESVLSGKPDFDIVASGILDDLLRFGSDVGHVLPVGMLHELLGSADTHVAMIGDHKSNGAFARKEETRERRYTTYIPSTPVSTAI